MKTRLILFLELISANFWMIPLFFLLASIALAFFNFYLDKSLFAQHIEIPGLYLYFNNSQNIRALLSVSAGSILGVAGVSFSITIASLTLASQQFGPRLLRNFMLDRFNQTVLGIFIGTFLYCILMLQFTSSMDLEKTTPFISMISLLVLIIVNLLALVFFIHHIAVAIQADSVIADVNTELRSQLEALFPEENDENTKSLKLKAPENISEKFSQQGSPIHTSKSGYLQAIDIENSIELANDNDIALKFIVKPGDFLINGSQVAYYLGNMDEETDTISDQINAKLIIGDISTAEQDPEFAIRQLVEVAVRALSPGINDPFTAITCIDRLGDSVAFLINRQFPSDQYSDDSGNLRLQLRPFTFSGIVEAAFNQIRQHGKNDVAVTIRLLQTLLQISMQLKTQEQADAIQLQAEALYSGHKDTISAEKDRQDIEKCFESIQQQLSSFRDKTAKQSA